MNDEAPNMNDRAPIRRDAPSSVAVIGAGLTGCLLACYLARRGHEVTVYERRADPRGAGAERGRSINLAISARGRDALRRIGLEEQVMAGALPMRGRMIHSVEGRLDFQSYSHDGTAAINSISRSALNATLLDAAEAAPGVKILFGHRLTGLDPATGELTFESGTTRADVVIGADGAGSAVRAHLGVREGVDLLDHGYRELTIPAAGGEFALDPGALHIWPRGGSMMIALPNPDRSFTCTLFWPKDAFDGIGDVEGHFREHYPDVVALIPDLVADYRANPVGTLGTVRCRPWHAAGRAALVGDAAHAIVPFYGQGANCGFEDVVELDHCLEETGGDWARALPLYEARRRPNTEAIAMMALENFVEMRDKVASPLFRTVHSLEHRLESLLPGLYVSRYELVSFSTMPYARVVRRVRLQRRLLAGLVTAAILGAGLAACRATGRSSRWR